MSRTHRNKNTSKKKYLDCKKITIYKKLKGEIHSSIGYKNKSCFKNNK